MNIAVLGTGVVGQNLAGKLASRGHAVSLGTRDPDAARAREPARNGAVSLAAFLDRHPTVALRAFAQAAADAELVINATSGSVSLDVLAAAGADNLAGKVVVDVSNPLDFSKGFPPTLTVCNDDSVGERLQRAFPAARVVKALNMVNTHLMVDPRSLADGDHTLLICGDDPAAKAVVKALLVDDFGWRDVVDAGGIGVSRGLEMYLPLWVRLSSALKTSAFSIKLVR